MHFTPKRQLPPHRPVIPAAYVERIDLLPRRVREAVKRATRRVNTGIIVKD